MKQLLFLFLLLINLTAIAQNPPPLKQRSDGSFTQGDTYLAVLKGLQIPSGTVNTLTGTGTRVNLFYNTTDNVLYIHNGIEWKPAIEADLTMYYTKSEIDTLFASSGNFIKASPTTPQDANIVLSGNNTLTLKSYDDGVGYSVFMHPGGGIQLASPSGTMQMQTGGGFDMNVPGGALAINTNNIGMSNSSGGFTLNPSILSLQSLSGDGGHAWLTRSYFNVGDNDNSFELTKDSLLFKNGANTSKILVNPNVMGKVEYLMPDSGGKLALLSQVKNITASNGLTKTGNDIKLGGKISNDYIVGSLSDGNKLSYGTAGIGGTSVYSFFGHGASLTGASRSYGVEVLTDSASNNGTLVFGARSSEGIKEVTISTGSLNPKGLVIRDDADRKGLIGFSDYYSTYNPLKDTLMYAQYGGVKKLIDSAISKDVGSPLTFSNGLTNDNGHVRLGGDGGWSYNYYAAIGNNLDKSTLYLGSTNTYLKNLNNPLFQPNISLYDNSMFLGYNSNGSPNTGFYFSPTERRFQDASSKGLYYDSKYRANLTNRWLTDKEYVDSLVTNISGYPKLNQSNTFTSTQDIVGDLNTTSGASFGVSSTTAGVKIGRITNNLVYLSCQDAAGNPKALSITATATTYNGNVNFNDNMQLVGSLSMASLSGIGDRPIVADAGGVLKIGNPVVGLEDLETKANVKKTFNFSDDDFQCLFSADIEIVRASTKAITVNFGSASEVTGRVVTIKKTDYSGYPVYIQPLNGEYIEEGWGATLVNPYDYITLVSDGTNWLILGGKYTLIYPQG